MAQFRDIKELAGCLNRNSGLLYAIFTSRTVSPLTLEEAEDKADDGYDRIQELVGYGVLNVADGCVELEDVHMQYFLDVLHANEEINVGSINQTLADLHDNIEYYLNEFNPSRQYQYLRKIRTLLQGIDRQTQRGATDLKRLVEDTYKNEPNLQNKRAKLDNLNKRAEDINALIDKTTELVRTKEVFVMRTDGRMATLLRQVNGHFVDTKYLLTAIILQILDYINRVEYQNESRKIVRRLKYLRDQHTITEHTNVREIMEGENGLWLEPERHYRTNPSLSDIENDDRGEVYRIMRKIIDTGNSVRLSIRRQSADALPDEFLKPRTRTENFVNISAVFDAFCASGNHLHEFLRTYPLKSQNKTEEEQQEEILVLYCQIVSMYRPQLRLTNDFERVGRLATRIVYPT